MSGEVVPPIPKRRDLIALCNRGLVPQAKWHNRDSASAQSQLAVCRALLMAGCEFRQATDPKSDENTLWIEVTVKGFAFHEYGESDPETFYLPTAKRLSDRAGMDWY